MPGNTSWAAEVRLQYIGVADSANPWRAGSERPRRIGFPTRSSMTFGIPWGQSTQAPKC
jgi:hypothetical protein